MNLPEDLKKYGDDYIIYMKSTNPNLTAQDVISKLETKKGISFTNVESIGLYKYIQEKLPETQINVDSSEEMVPVRMNTTKTPSSKLKKIQLILFSLILFLVLTNPSAKRFKEYLGESSYDGLRRTNNFLLFSIYNDGNYIYFGAAFNFFKLMEEE